MTPAEARAIKARHAARLKAEHPSIQGFGIGGTDDAPTLRVYLRPDRPWTGPDTVEGLAVEAVTVGTIVAGGAMSGVCATCGNTACLCCPTCQRPDCACRVVSPEYDHEVIFTATLAFADMAAANARIAELEWAGDGLADLFHQEFAGRIVKLAEKSVALERWRRARDGGGEG